MLVDVVAAVLSLPQANIDVSLHLWLSELYCGLDVLVFIGRHRAYGMLALGQWQQACREACCHSSPCDCGPTG